MTDHAQKMLKIHRRRLEILQEQAAAFGLHTPPHIAIEIEDLEAEIAALLAQNPALAAAEEEKPAGETGVQGGVNITVHGNGNVIATGGGIAVGGNVGGDITTRTEGQK